MFATETRMGLWETPPMIAFETLRARAAARKGGDEALAALMPAIKSGAELAAMADDRWLSTMSRCVFQAGFSWSVVDKKWPGFEEAFWGFDPARCRAMDDEAFDGLLKDTRIIRNGAKVRSVARNAALLMDLAAEHGSAARCFADWPAEDYAGLLNLLKTRGDRLGGGAGAMSMRFMGRDGWVLSPDVVKALIGAGVIDGPPGSQKSMKAIQAAFNAWAAESGAPFAHISRTLALSVD
ncbi:MAG: DNA-3-methyladenine glycosylase I [Caulobacter sp.]|nr:DNA-3-methyladenine glycosylase I [Caulobacter sp.]